MRAVIMENTQENLNQLRDCIHELLPTAIVSGFTDGNEAIHWCQEHASEIDLFFGNWWGISEEFSGPEGAAVPKRIKWVKKPKVVFMAENEMFHGWSVKEGADAFFERPVSIGKLRSIFEKLGI